WASVPLQYWLSPSSSTRSGPSARTRRAVNPWCPPTLAMSPAATTTGSVAEPARGRCVAVTLHSRQRSLDAPLRRIHTSQPEDWLPPPPAVGLPPPARPGHPHPPAETRCRDEGASTRTPVRVKR